MMARSTFLRSIEHHDTLRCVVYHSATVLLFNLWLRIFERWAFSIVQSSDLVAEDGIHRAMGELLIVASLGWLCTFLGHFLTCFLVVFELWAEHRFWRESTLHASLRCYYKTWL